MAVFVAPLFRFDGSAKVPLCPAKTPSLSCRDVKPYPQM